MNEAEFKQQVFSFTEYTPQLLEQFFNYWSETIVKGKDKGKMLWESKTSWQLSKRIARFKINQDKWNGKSFNNTSNTAPAGTSVKRVEALRNWGK